jgi:membrane-associated phospholipid phosphatase
MSHPLRTPADLPSCRSFGKRANVILLIVMGLFTMPMAAVAQLRMNPADFRMMPALLLAQPAALGEDTSAVAPTESSSAETALPDAPSAAPQVQSNSAMGGVGTAVRTIGSDELHMLKAPFRKSAIKWDILFVGATGALIATDEQVLHQVPASWHQTGLNISDAGAYGAAAIAGGIYLTGLVTKNEHAQETGILTTEATIDSVIFYGAAKAIFQRQRPYTGEGEGNFFAGNWSSGSFPSGHAMFTWTIASSVAHQYRAWPVQVLMYGMATAVSVTRVTSAEHFPSDVFVGSVLGYLVGAYVSGKPTTGFPIRSQNKVKRIENAVLQHVTIQ